MKQLFKSVMLLALFFTTYHMNAQCQFDKDEIDKFSKERVVHTKGKILWMNLGAAIGVQGKNIGGSKFLTVQISSGTVFSVTKGDELKLLLEDGSIVSLESAENLISDYNNINGIQVWSALINYYLPEQEFNKLKNSSVETVRIYTTGNKYFEKEVKKKHSQNIAELMECIDL